MASMDQLETALINADKAGDTQAATILAQEIQKMRGTAQTEIPGPRTFIPRPFETISNIPSSAMKMGGELVGAVMSPIETAKGLSDVAAGGMRAAAQKVLPEKVFQWIDALDNPETTQRITATANAVGKDYADAYGSYDRIVKTIEQDPVRAMGDLSLILGVAGKAATASKMAQTGETLSGAARVIDPLALPIAGVNKLADVAAPAVSYAQNALSPMYRMLEPALEGRGEQYVSALLNQPLPSAPRLAGEILAAEGVAGTQYPALEQKLTQKFAPTALQEMEDARRAARATMLREIAKTPAVVEDAVKAREAAIAPLYDRVRATPVEVDDTLSKLMKRPAISEAFNAAEEVARNRGEPFIRGETKPAQMVPSRVLGPDGQPIMVEIPATTARMTGNDLLRVKYELDRAVAPLPSTATPAEKTARAGAVTARKDLMAWMEKNIPEFGTANKTFAELSKPINVMGVGQTLLDALEAPLTGEATRAGVFANAVRNAQQTLKKATGEARFEKLTDILSPEDAAKVQRVLKDLQSVERYKELGRAGRAGIADVTGAEILAPSGLLDRFATIATRVIDAVEGRMNRSTAMAIAAAAQDPAMLAKMIERVATKEQRLGAREASIRATTQKVTNAMRGTAPILNVLAAEQQP